MPGYTRITLYGVTRDPGGGDLSPINGGSFGRTAYSKATGIPNVWGGSS